MKLLSCAMLLAVVGLSGCVTLDTPGYTASERFAAMGRNYVYEQKQFNDDIDHALSLRPASQMSIWNVVHKD